MCRHPPLASTDLRPWPSGGRLLLDGSVASEHGLLEELGHKVGGGFVLLRQLHVARHADGGRGGRQRRVESRLAAVVRGGARVPEQARLGPDNEKLSERREELKVSDKQLSEVHMEDTSQDCVVTL